MPYRMNPWGASWMTGFQQANEAVGETGQIKGAGIAGLGAGLAGGITESGRRLDRQKELDRQFGMEQQRLKMAQDKESYEREKDKAILTRDLATGYEAQLNERMSRYGPDQLGQAMSDPVVKDLMSKVQSSRAASLAVIARLGGVNVSGSVSSTSATSDQHGCFGGKCYKDAPSFDPNEKAPAPDDLTPSPVALPETMATSPVSTPLGRLMEAKLHLDNLKDDEERASRMKDPVARLTELARIRGARAVATQDYAAADQRVKDDEARREAAAKNASSRRDEAERMATEERAEGRKHEDRNREFEETSTTALNDPYARSYLGTTYDPNAETESVDPQGNVTREGMDYQNRPANLIEAKHAIEEGNKARAADRVATRGQARMEFQGEQSDLNRAAADERARATRAQNEAHYLQRYGDRVGKKEIEADEDAIAEFRKYALAYTKDGFVLRETIPWAQISSASQKRLQDMAADNNPMLPDEIKRLFVAPPKDTNELLDRANGGAPTAPASSGGDPKARDAVASEFNALPPAQQTEAALAAIKRKHGL